MDRCFERGDAAGFAAFFRDLLDAADREPGVPQGLVPRHPGADQLFDLPLIVELQLRRQLAFHVRAPEDCPQPVLRSLTTVGMDPPHAISRIWPMVTDSVRQAAASVSSCLRPARVSS